MLANSVMLYNMPGNTGINMTSDLVAELAEHPKIVGEKKTAQNIVQVAETISKTSPDFTVLLVRPVGCCQPFA